MNDLRKRTINGLSWSLNGQIIIQIISFIVWIIMARLLSPNDFGLIAMVIVISRFLQLFRNLGLFEAIIQTKELDIKLTSSVFWIHVLNGLFIACLFWWSSSFLSMFFDESLLIEIINLVALDFFLGSFFIVPLALLNKKLSFKKIFTIDFISLIVSATIGILLALNGMAYFSLIFKMISLTIVSGLLTIYFSEWRPIFNIDVKRIKVLFRFSLPLVQSQILKYCIRNIDDLLIGKEFGKQSLGIYNRSYAIMLLPLKHITNGVSKVLFPVFSIIQDDFDSIGRSYLKAARLIALISFPLMIGLCLLSDEVIIIFLGSQWKAMIPLVKILSILGMFQSISALNGSIFLSLNKTKLQLKISLASGALIISAIIFGVYYVKHVLGVTILYAIASCLAAVPIWYLLGKLINLSLSKIIKNLASILFCALGMGFLLLLTNQLDFWELCLSHLILKSVLGGLCYLVLIIVFKVKAFSDLKLIFAEYFWKNKS